MNLIEKWSAVGSLSITVCYSLTSVQLYGSLHHYWGSFFTYADWLHVLLFPFRFDILSQIHVDSLQLHLSLITSWSIRGIQKVSDSNSRRWNVERFYFPFVSQLYSCRIRPDSDSSLPVTNRVHPMHTNDVSLLLCFCFHDHCRAVVVNVDDSHVSSVISAREVSRIFSSVILWIKLYVVLYDVLNPMIPIDSSSFLILDSSSILMVRNWPRRLNHPDVFWISSIQIRTPRVSSSCRSVLVRTTTSSSVFKTSLSNSYSFRRMTFSWSILLSIPYVLRSSVSICLSFMSIHHRNYGNLFSTVIQDPFYSGDPVVVSRCIPKHF